jgi:hypothetical protein
MGAKIILAGFCPEWDGYHELASVDRAEFEFVARLADTPALAGFGKPGEEGHAAAVAAINALKSKSSMSAAFTKIMEQLAKTISKSVAVEAADC